MIGLPNRSMSCTALAALQTSTSWKEGKEVSSGLFKSKGAARNMGDSIRQAALSLPCANMTQDAIDLLVHPVAVHEKRVAMEVRVVQVHFIALCHHMPPHPVASPHHSQNCCP